jgi:hypothetical protein
MLSETVEERPTALDICWYAGGDDEELARCGGIRISEDRRMIAFNNTRLPSTDAGF